RSFSACPTVAGSRGVSSTAGSTAFAGEPAAGSALAVSALAGGAFPGSDAVPQPIMDSNSVPSPRPLIQCRRAMTVSLFEFAWACKHRVIIDTDAQKARSAARDFRGTHWTNERSCPILRSIAPHPLPVAWFCAWGASDSLRFGAEAISIEWGERV